MRNKFKQYGFSIVELMVALLLGLFLMGGVTGMYISGKQTYRMTDNLSRLQESMRFSLDFISQDVRMAGYTSCRNTPAVTNVINGSGASWFLDFFNFGIRGFEGNTPTPATFPAEIISDAVDGSDAIAILKGGNYTSSINFHNTSGSILTLENSFYGNSSDFQDGEIAIVCDPRQTSIFQISDVVPASKTISYGDNSNIAPGNSAVPIGTFGEDAQITPYEPVIYYIAQSTQDPTVNSLKKRSLVAFNVSGTETAQMDEEELLEGVETMQILYGLDIDNDQIADRFETANDITAAEWPNVITVRLGLLMSTGEDVTADVDTNSYNVAGTMVAAPGIDKKLRYAVNTTINIRNRIQQN